MLSFPVLITIAVVQIILYNDKAHSYFYQCKIKVDYSLQKYIHNIKSCAVFYDRSTNILYNPIFIWDIKHYDKYIDYLRIVPCRFTLSPIPSIDVLFQFARPPLCRHLGVVVHWGKQLQRRHNLGRIDILPVLVEIMDNYIDV